MKRNYCSGSEKRKRQKIKHELEIKQKDSLFVFLKPRNDEASDEATGNNDKAPSSSLHLETTVEQITVSEECEDISGRPNTSLTITDNYKQGSENNESKSNEHELIYNIDKSQLNDNLPCVKPVTSVEHVPIPYPYPQDIALWPRHLTQDMVEYYLINKPKSVGNLKNVKKQYMDKGKQYYRNLNESHFYRVKKMEPKNEENG